MAIHSTTISIDGSDVWTLRQAEIVGAVCAYGFINAEALSTNVDLQPGPSLGQRFFTVE